MWIKCLRSKLEKFQREDEKQLLLYIEFPDSGNGINYKGKDFHKQTSQNICIISYKIDMI